MAVFYLIFVGYCSPWLSNVCWALLFADFVDCCHHCFDIDNYCCSLLFVYLMGIV